MFDNRIDKNTRLVCERYSICGRTSYSSRSYRKSVKAIVTICYSRIVILTIYFSTIAKEKTESIRERKLNLQKIGKNPLQLFRVHTNFRLFRNFKKKLLKSNFKLSSFGNNFIGFYSVFDTNLRIDSIDSV